MHQSKPQYVAPGRRPRSPVSDSPPSEAWLFAQAVLGQPVGPSAAQAEAEMAAWEHRQWLAAVAPMLEGRWDPAKHPRGAYPQNRGWFSPTQGSSATAQSGQRDPVPNGPHRPRRPAIPIRTVSDREPKRGGRDAANRSSAPGISPSDERVPDATAKLDSNDLHTYFHVLYGERGQKLLKAFEKSGGRILLENPWFGAASALDTRNVWHPQQIRIRQDSNPADAAEQLMDRLIEASGLTEVRQHLDHSGFDNIELLIDSYKQSAQQAAGAVALAAELYVSGISLASEGADWVVTVHELSEGNYYAAIGLLPLLPATVGKTGVVLKHGRQSLRVSLAEARKIKGLPIDELIGLLESTRLLARNMEKAGIARPAGTAAHHIVPASLKKFKSADRARKILNKFGIALENAANGVYLPSKFDDAVKAAYHGTLHTERYFDEVLRRLSNARSKADVLVILDGIRNELLRNKFPR